MKPYFEAPGVTLYHGDCHDILPSISGIDAVITDPPYPNNADHFCDGVAAAMRLIETFRFGTAMIFWSELESPPCCMPIVAVHIWHRTNVNGRPYEPIFHFCQDGLKRRSEIKEHAAVFGGVGPGCSEYLGHPTQKPVALMQWLIEKSRAPEGAVIADPYFGSGSTAIACIRTKRKFVGIEVNEKFCRTAADRIDRELSQGVFVF